MIVNCDAKALEVYCAAYLSQDQTMHKELWEGLDMHSLNQEAFNLPSRLIAKVLQFRILYGGTGYSFSKDPNFMDVSTSEKYWNSKIEDFYSKYKGLDKWHNNIVQEVIKTGKLSMPTGRLYNYSRTLRGDWPLTTIKNYPVQGLGADIMSIARVSFMKRFKDANIAGVIVNTVHDSIVCDVRDNETQRVANLFYEVFADIPTNFNRIFGVQFTLPVRCEVSVGNNMKELEEVKF